MKIGTRKFGDIHIEAGKILTMPEGLPGFPGFDHFVLIEDKKTAPFCWFQSTQAPDLALVVMDPFLFMPDYQVNVDILITEMDWKNSKRKDLLIYVVVNISRENETKTITANLMGPLVINTKNNQAVQLIMADSPYSCQYDILAASSA